MFNYKPLRKHGPSRSGSSLWYLWWLNPVPVLAIMLLLTGLSAYLIPPAAYLQNWSTPKFINTQEFLYIVYVILAFCAGGLLVSAVSGPLKYRESEKMLGSYLPWQGLWTVFYITFGLVLAAYMVWFVILLSSGLSLSSLAAGLKGEAGAAYEIRGGGETLPGVTTFTQLEMGLFILGLILGFKFGWRKNFYRLVAPLVIVFCITWIRSKLWSERLAVMELAVPTTVLLVRLARAEAWSIGKRFFAAAAPLAAPPILFLFFSAAEYSRSWSQYYSETQNSFFLFSFMRLIGYYATALNNGAALTQVMHHYDVPFHTWDWFWRFPAIKVFLPYKAIANAEPWDDYHELLSRMANPEFNNPSGVFVVRLDYGFTGALFVWFGLGVIAMLLYRSFIKGSFAGLLMYPFFFIGLLESPRVFYWSLARAFPTWALLFALLLLVLFTSQAVTRRPRAREGLLKRPLAPVGMTSRQLTKS